MGLVGSNIFGHETLAEIRVNAAQDLGDRRGETNVSLLGNPGFAQSARKVLFCCIVCSGIGKG